MKVWSSKICRVLSSYLPVPLSSINYPFPPISLFGELGFPILRSSPFSLAPTMERHRGDRDRDRDYRDRDRDRNFNHHQQRRPSRFSDAPPVDRRRSPSSFRVRSIDSPPRDSATFHPPPGGVPTFNPSGGAPPGGFWPMGGDVGGGFGNEFMGPPRPMMPPQAQAQLQQQPPILSGQKRGFPFSAPAGSPDNHDGKSFVKLFVGSVPRTVTEDEVRPLFEEQGKVLEVALIKDKRTGQQQGMCFRVVLNYCSLYYFLLSGVLLCCAGDGSKCKLCFVSVSFCNNFGTLDIGCDLSFKSALSNKKKQQM